VAMTSGNYQPHRKLEEAARHYQAALTLNPEPSQVRRGLDNLAGDGAQ